jgi:glycosyltransferase involved in cell wall biosynthesis
MLERLKALHKSGIRIYLHYFIRDNEEVSSESLKPYCEEVFTYRRNSPIKGLLKGHPYIIACRAAEDLYQRLCADNHSILFDGIHTTAFLNKLYSPNRKIVVRMHNDEVQYYKSLIRFERNIIKRFYFLWESFRLKHWMHQLPKAIPLGCVQESERSILANDYGFAHAFILPPPIPETVESIPGTGGYCLYHGNLSIGENESAAIWLLKRVFAELKLPLVIAGKNPSSRLEKLVHFYQHACLVANPGTEEMRDLIRKAQLHILPSKTRTGIKQKIFDVLQYGRHCIVNDNMRHASPWTDTCEVASNAKQMATRVRALYQMPFTQDMIEERKIRLYYWRNQLNPVEALIKRLW